MIFNMERQQVFKLALICSAAISLQGCVAAAFPVLASGLMVSEGGNVPDDRPAAEVAEAPPEPAQTQAPATVPAQAQGQTSVAEAETTGIVEVDRAPGQTSAALATAPGTLAPIEAIPIETSSVETAPANIAPVDVAQDTSPASSVPNPAESATPPEAQIVAAPQSVVPEVQASSTATALPQTDEDAVQSLANRIEPDSAMDAPETGADNSAQLASADVTAAVPPVVPAPGAGNPVTGLTALPAPSTGTLFDPLFSYATSDDFAKGGSRVSASLVDATNLDPERQTCSAERPTVLIDLDPAEGNLLPIDPLSASPALADRLSKLRAQGITIAWISEQPSDFEPNLRAALFRSGLDRTGLDEVLLMRSVDDRKQTRRDQLAQNTCLIAIAGDEQSDFHELFDYLRNPRDARALEPMMGDGWFLIPTPLLALES